MKAINEKAPVVCSKSILIDADLKKVWEVLTNIDKWALWQSDITEPKLLGELKVDSTFVWKTGGVKIHSKLHTVESQKQFGWTGKTFGLYAIHNWSLSEKNDQVLVEVSESMEGLFALIFKKSFNRNLETGMLKWLELLKLECEK